MAASWRSHAAFGTVSRAMKLVSAAVRSPVEPPRGWATGHEPSNSTDIVDRESPIDNDCHPPAPWDHPAPQTWDHLGRATTGRAP